MQLARTYNRAFDENSIVIVEDSHGVGAFGTTGRGTEEFTQSGRVDLPVATLGKAFGINGGYIAGDDTIIRYLRETSLFYIFSNPLAPARPQPHWPPLTSWTAPPERACRHLRAMTARVSAGIVILGVETLLGEHPVVRSRSVYGT